MNENTYKMLGLVAWRGARWYVKRRGLSTLTVATVGAGGLVVLGTAAVIARRSAQRSAERKQLPPGPLAA